jgi:RasGEF domain
MEGSMTIQDVNTNINFHTPLEWTGLITRKQNEECSLSTEKIFEIYTQSSFSIDAPSRTVKNEKLRRFRVLFRNFYMEAIISGNEEKAIEVCHTLTYFGENYTELFKDIHQLFKEGYNPTWKTGLVYLQLLIKEKTLDTGFIKNLLQLNYDGENSLLDIDNDQLLAYRVVNSIKKLNVVQKESLLELSQKRFQEIEEKHSCISESHCSLFDTTYYYLVVLSNHQKLRINITDLIQFFCRDKTPDDKLNYSADDLIKILLTGEKDTCEKIIKMLDHLKKCVNSSYFKLDLNKLEEMNTTKLKLENINPRKLSGSKHRTLEKQLLDLSVKAPLPHIYRKAVLPKLITEITDGCLSKPEKRLDKLHTLTQWLYQSTESAEIFQTESIQLAVKIYELTALLLKSGNINILNNSWKLLCHGKLNSKQLEKVLDDLNMECVRLLRLVMLKDINPDLKKYDEKAKRTYPPVKKSNSFTLNKITKTIVNERDRSNSQSNIIRLKSDGQVIIKSTSIDDSECNSHLIEITESYRPYLSTQMLTRISLLTPTDESPRSSLSFSPGTSPGSEDDEKAERHYTPVKKSNSLPLNKNAKTLVNEASSSNSQPNLIRRKSNNQVRVKSTSVSNFKRNILLTKGFTPYPSKQTPTGISLSPQTDESPRSSLSFSSGTSPRSEDEVAIDLKSSKDAIILPTYPLEKSVEENKLDELKTIVDEEKPEHNTSPKKSIEISNFFNNLTNLTIYHILNAKNDKSAAEVIKNTLLFAQMAVESQKSNLTVAYAITAALQTNAITRLKTPFSLLGEKYHAINRKLNELFSPTNNYKTYRNHCKKSSTPVIPFLGVQQKEFMYLTESDSEKQDIVKDKVCDSLYKMQYLLKITHLIKPHQTDCYETISNPSILLNMQRPPRKIDIEVNEEFKEEEWKSLGIPEKLYYFSRFHWPEKENKKKVVPRPEQVGLKTHSFLL